MTFEWRYPKIHSLKNLRAIVNETGHLPEDCEVGIGFMALENRYGHASITVYSPEPIS